MCTKGSDPFASLFLFVIPNPDIMSWCCKRSPRDVEPTCGGQQLVSQIVSLEEVHEALELAGVLGADVGGLALQMLRVANATNEGVDTGVAVAGVDDDRANHLAGGLQEHQAAIGHVRHVLHGGLVVGVLAQIEKLAQTEVGRQSRVIELCVFH